MICFFCRWYETWLQKNDPALKAEIDAAAGRFRDWDYNQANDSLIWELENEKERVREAGLMSKTDPVAAFRLRLALAEGGSVWSMVDVAHAYMSGSGVASNPALAEEWLHRAYESGSERALLSYCRILGLRGDFTKCEAVLGRAAANDWAPALYWLARYKLRSNPTRRTLVEVRPLLERAAAKGSFAAQKFLATKMITGQLGVRSMLRGVRLMLKAKKPGGPASTTSFASLQRIERGCGDPERCQVKSLRLGRQRAAVTQSL